MDGAHFFPRVLTRGEGTLSPSLPEEVDAVARGRGNTRPRRVRVRGESTRVPLSPPLPGEIEPARAVAVPRGRGNTGSRRVRVRGGSTGVPLSPPLPGEIEPARAVAVPRGRGNTGSRRVRVRGGSTGVPLSPPLPGEIEPARAVAVPRGRGNTKSRRARVRGGSGNTSLGLGEGAVVEPRGGSARGRGVQGARGGGVRGARGRGVRGGRSTGSARPGPSTIEDLDIYEIEDLPGGQSLETALHPIRKRQWEPSVPARRPTPQPPHVEDVLQASPSPQFEDVPPASPPPSPSLSNFLPSPALMVECELSEPSTSNYRPRQSLQDEEIYKQLFYGSESDSDESDDGVALCNFSRTQRSAWDTPLDDDVADSQPVTTTGTTADAITSSDSVHEVTPSATDQPWGVYEFDWKPFPNVPIPPGLRRERFSEINLGPTAPCVDPYDIFIGIWDRQFMEYIASETNRYAQQLTSHLIESNSIHPQSRITSWHDTNADELYVYFGLVLAMGVVVKSRINEYWTATPDVFYTPGFSAHMSCHRFALISRCLHFVNNETMCALELNSSEAKLFKIKPLLSHLNNKFQSMYRLGQNIALDESLLMWKGWLDISQLIPNKTAAMGIKTYEICESQTGYLWRFEVHAIGKSQRSPPQQFEDPMKASTPAIVLRLIQGLEGKGHTLWMDNFYNSPCLARKLKTLGFDCVGTLRTNRKFVPQALHSLTKGNMTKGQISGLTSGDVDIMVWRDSNRVAMISTYHGNGVSQIKNTTKPILILDYNIMMGGVDKKDQMLAMYPIERKRTKVWYKKLFRRLLNVSVLNAYVIHHKSSSTSHSALSHRNFRISLIKSLLSKHCSSSSQLATRQYQPLSSRHDLRLHHLAEFPFGDTRVKHQRRRRKCASCGRLVQTYCVGCSKTMCMHPCYVALHL